MSPAANESAQRQAFRRGLATGAGIVLLAGLGGLYLLNMSAVIAVSVMRMPGVEETLAWAHRNLGLSLLPFAAALALYLLSLLRLHRLLTQSAAPEQIAHSEQLLDIWVALFFGIGVLWTAIGMRDALIFALADPAETRIMGNLPWENLTGVACDNTNSEMEALQTDVMRFLAILALCLMAIFALVQSIPMLPAESNPQLENRETLQHQIKVLEQSLAVLVKEAAVLEKRVSQARKMDAQTSRRAQQQQAKAEASRQRARSSQQAATAAQKALKETQAALNKQQTRVAMLRAESAQAQLSLRALQQRIAKEQVAQERLQANLEAVRATSDPAVEGTEDQSRADEPEQGFSLRFASTQALLDLLGRGVVDFYAGVGSQYWKLKPAANAHVFELSANPLQLYEMTPATVPAELVRALRSSVASFDHQQVIWGVTLPASATADVRRLMSIRQGGVLSIQADGSVVHADEPR